jgi:hypothetical protein
MPEAAAAKKVWLYLSLIQETDNTGFLLMCLIWQLWEIRHRALLDHRLSCVKTDDR